jgi:PAS domain S-box-containing protein
MLLFNKKSSHIQNNLLYKVADLEERLTLASACLEKISKGDFDLKLNGALKHSNGEGQNLIDLLKRTNSKLSEYSLKENQRHWISEGVSKFMDLTRGDSSAQSDFYNRIISFLVKYTQANQGGVFMLNDDNPNDAFLELVACYAYSRKKFLEKRIDPGQGLLGQCFLEKETTQYTQIPNSYVTITSGLGEATATYLLLVPMKHNEEVVGVMELASFAKMEPFKVEFIERIAENMASVFVNIKSARKVERLLRESEQKSKIMEESQEELRQNFEELSATQEEMKRNQLKLDQQTALLKLIVDNIPFPVFVKDETGKYTIVNKVEAKLFNMAEADLIGKDDSHFVVNDDEWRMIQESDARVIASELPVELPMQYFTTKDGASYVFKTTKVPFINTVTGRKNILGVSIDLTEKIDLERELLREKSITEKNLLVNVIGRQRMLSQKIGFYSETLFRGKKNSGTLKQAIDLFGHSLYVIWFGGTPNGISVDKPLPKAALELIPFIEKIEKEWTPFKEAAENLLLSFTDESGSNSTAENSITYIEEHAENLLKLNNDLIVACIALGTDKTSAL